MRIRPADAAEPYGQTRPTGRCIDFTDLETSTYELDPQLLRHGSDPRSEVAESLYSNLLKTNCPLTGQPDWATVLIRYRGPKIRRRPLLAYLVSYRRHAEFHEQCVERMFLDLQRYCRPRALTVYARYLRRGGLDINPFRSNFEAPPAERPRAPPVGARPTRLRLPVRGGFTHWGTPGVDVEAKRPLDYAANNRSRST